MKSGFQTGLREYETMEQVFERCTNAYYYDFDNEVREAYAILSEAAENGDEDAICYLAKWYSTFPIKYGKKRNRILQTGKTHKCLLDVITAYEYGYYCEKNETKAQIYRNQLADTSSVFMKDEFRRAYLSNGYKEGLKWVEKYQKKFGEFRYYQDLTEAVMYTCVIRNEIKNNTSQRSPAEIEKLIRSLLEVDWSKESYFVRERWPAILKKLGGITASFAYWKKDMHAEALDVIWIAENIWTIADMTRIILGDAPESLVESGIIRLWKSIENEEYDSSDRKKANNLLQEMLAEYRKKGTLLYARLIKLAQEAGCPGADSEAAKVQEYFRDESMLSQALEVLETSNYRSAIQELNRLFEKGNVEAGYHLGLVYYQGTKVPRDVEKAKAYMEKAAKAGYEDAERMVEKWKTGN